jgi:hypothetical protein
MLRIREIISPFPHMSSWPGAKLSTGKTLFSLQEEEVRGGWRKLHEEVYNLCSSLIGNVTGVMKSKMMN